TGTGRRFRRAAQEILTRHPSAVRLAAQALTSARQEVRAAAADWLGRIGGSEGIEPLRAALRVEKREPVQAAMLGALSVLGDDIGQHLTPEALGRAAATGLARIRPPSLDWFVFEALPECRWRDGAPVDPQILRWWVVLADKLKDPAGAGLIPIYVSLLDRPSQEALGAFVLDVWVARDTAHPGDAEARQAAETNTLRVWTDQQRWAQRAADNPWAATAGEETQDAVFERLRRAEAGRLTGSAIAHKGMLALISGAPGHLIAATCQRFIKDHRERRAQIEALVTAAATNTDPAAIQFVLAMARSHHQRSVRDKALELAGQIAERSGWSMEELTDRTIPTAGFDSTGMLALDFGRRQFTGRIIASPATGHLGIELRTADGKTLKALPKPTREDDDVLAAQARKQFLAAKRELSQVTALQRSRLYEAMCLGRSWTVADWQASFAAHPVMRQVVATLVWQATTPDGSDVLFRPTPDGELIDAADDATHLLPDAQVRMAHLITVTSDQAQAWRAHLRDYAVIPLFDQFAASMPVLSDPFLTELTDRQGWMSDTFAIRGRATKRGYTHAPAEDGGQFTEYHKEMTAAGITVRLGFTGSFVPEARLPAAMTQLTFTDTGWRTIRLAQVPQILLAEAYADYVYVAEAGSFDPEWGTKT
ncbi:MAG: DUF4132 domain-containing protein, partial [Bifidobacteriaceae bacterium]|nr:DUF4132 domain-containing protein [Bifidobacteriaceae bacterium]